MHILLFMAAYAIGQAIIFLSCGFFYLSIYLLFPRLISAVADWMSTILPHMMWPNSANLGCRSETCCTRLPRNAGRKKIVLKIAILAPSHNVVGPYHRNWHTLTIGKNC